MTDIRSSTPLVPSGMAVKLSFPIAFWAVLKVQWALPESCRSPLAKEKSSMWMDRWPEAPQGPRTQCLVPVFGVPWPEFGILPLPLANYVDLRECLPRQGTWLPDLEKEGVGFNHPLCNKTEGTQMSDGTDPQREAASKSPIILVIMTSCSNFSK